MKNIFILALSLLSLASFAQHENALLYRVTGNGIQPSYVFGTIHLTCDSNLDKNVIEALNATSQMYLELDMDDSEMQSQMMKMMPMQDGVTLSTLLSGEDFKKLDALLQTKLNISAKMVDTYKPFIISSMFLTTLLDCKPQSIEGELMRISALQEEPIFGLETVEEQMSIFDEIPYRLQAEELMKSVKNDFKDDKTEFSQMLKTYAMKDLNELQRLTKESKSAIMTDYEELLLTNRNKNWIPIIEKVSMEKPTFFGVGAAHLIGEEGVISLLRRTGYVVEAIVN